MIGFFFLVQIPKTHEDYYSYNISGRPACTRNMRADLLVRRAVTSQLNGYLCLPNLNLLHAHTIIVSDSPEHCEQDAPPLGGASIILYNTWQYTEVGPIRLTELGSIRDLRGKFVTLSYCWSSRRHTNCNFDPAKANTALRRRRFCFDDDQKIRRACSRL